MTPQKYVEAFKAWMTDWQPDAFVTINLPGEHAAPRNAEFYLSLWTRVAEADLLGPRTLKLPHFDRRIVWLFRREVSTNKLVHFHAIVKFPTNRQVWRGETAGFDPAARYERVANALRAASRRTPEVHRSKGLHQPLSADIDVRPYRGDWNHAGYLLKGMRDGSTETSEFCTEELARDSGLIVLPHLPKKQLRRGVTT